MTTPDGLPLGLTMGDPAGCGPQISCMAWQQLRHIPEMAFFVVGPPELYNRHVPVREITSSKEAAACFSNALPVQTIGTDVDNSKTGFPSEHSAPAILGSIDTGVSLCLNGQAAGLITNPINKSLLYGSGFKYPGHTEYLAALCSSPDASDSIEPVMLLVGGGLRVALATIHMPLGEVSSALTTDLLVRIARTVTSTLSRDFAIQSPRLAFSGLNPHAGESGSIGKEEITIINPAANTLRSEGIDISDARPADTVFHEALSGGYDAVIAMTHDQGLIPVKTLDFWGGVNTTLGLPIIRTSPDHGTAYAAARAGTARPDSLIAAIRLAREMSENRACFNV